MAAPNQLPRAGWIPVFGLIVLSFLTATAYAQWRMLAIDSAALEIAENTAPGIERLSSARGEILQIRSMARSYAENGRDRASFDADPYEAARRRLGEHIDAYLNMPLSPGEHEPWTRIVRARAVLDEDLTLFEAEARQGGSEVTMARARDVLAATDELSTALTGSVKVDAQHSLELALQIRRVRTQTTILAFVLDAVCAIITVLAAIVLRRTLRSHAQLAEEHRRLHEERASEMEIFAGRVAHDILSPLGTVKLALDLAARPDVDDAQRRDVTKRGNAALDRVKRLVSGLLRFARAGAKPEAGARTEVEPTVADVVADLANEAQESGVELQIEHGGRYHVACDPGVLTSLVANLARNAIKYIGDGPARRVTIRTSQKADLVRVEVTDTGPGLPPGVEDLVFEPYVRASGTAKPGIGLGLATVKRMTEAHGGKVGVRSVPGQGSTFWFELPKAPPAEDGKGESGVVPAARIAG